MRKRRQAALVIFARLPQAGRVKTRLVPPLTREEALRLHIACLQSTARLAASRPAAIDKWLYLTARSLSQAQRAARQLRLPRALRVRAQRGRGLGGRLARAFAELRRDGYARVVVMGSDSPALDAVRLVQAFHALRRREAVLGPARDGGFYLIGLSERAPNHGRLFAGIAWGTPQAGRQMRARLGQYGCRVSLLPAAYDVDTSADLKRLARDIKKRRAAHFEPLRHWLAGRASGAKRPG
ncbi:MAG: TIGR04282 family arsenosugar biosynthesis glycosyltransferase [Candidatus Acidiferrales bacterium]